ncbi:MAG: class I SAM-dependent methyltransferase [Alphaproteobacteria bacterium]|nr:class I SAM-dependent methyltransferase [Alphaproteobacteria bacterium]
MPVSDQQLATDASAEKRDDGVPGALPTYVTAARHGPLVRARKWLVDAMVAKRSRQARRILEAKPELWALMTRVAAGTAVTGASYSDYLTLYEQVRAHRPREILECGTGISTVVLAQALRDNASEDGGTPGRVTSMEDDADWYRTARARLPDAVADIVEIVHSPKADGFFKCFRGVCYETLPDRPYDFVFSDGPDRHSPVNGDKLFNLDLINVVRRSERPVRAVVDNHYLTFYVLQKVFGLDKARYSISHKLMFVGPVTKHDVRHLKKETFVPDLRLFGTTELKLRMTLDD